MFPSPLETERLLLRRPVLADAPAIFKNYACNPRVSRYMSWPAHRSLADAESFLCDLAKAVEREEQFSWAIIDRATETLCGMIGVMLAPPRATFGYCLAEQVWGRGYATEATEAIVSVVWLRPEIDRLEAYCHTGHLRSARVLEKSGLRYVGIDRQHSVLPALGHHRQDMLRYAVARPRGR